MNRRILFVAAVVVVVLSASACRDTMQITDTPQPDTMVDDRVDTDTRPTDGPVMDGSDTPLVDVPSDGPAMDAPPRNVTIRQIQDIADPMHPAPGTVVTLNQSGMVALTPRLLIGSSNPSSGSCRFGVWVGDGMGGDFSAIQVQETIPLGDAGSCFDVMGRRLPTDLAIGDRISLVEDVDYGEFCAAGGGADAGTCRPFEQSNLFGPRTFTRAGSGPAPTPTTVTVMDLVMGTDGRATDRGLRLEGVLLELRNVRVRAVATGDGGVFTDVFVSDASDTMRSREIDVLVSNFVGTTCVRNYFRAQTGMVIPFVRGILVPDFGRWKLRLRIADDVAGAMCSSGDAGAGDGGMDASTGG